MINTRFSKKCFSAFIFLMLLIPLTVLASNKFNTQKRYLYVQPGQSVFSIVKVLYPNQQKQWPQIIKKVVKINPHAFIGADATKIKIGRKIELPAFFDTIKTPSTQHKVTVYKAPKAVGQVVKRRGKVFAISNKDKMRDLELGSEIFVGDRLFTGVKGFLRLNMIDEAKIDLRCNSEMLIEDYVLLRGGNRSVIHLIKGSVKKITGSIGRLADDFYQMHTPFATVGVRGTEYAIRVLQQHGCDGSLDVNSNGLFIQVNQGAIDVKSKKDKLVLNKDDAIHIENNESSAINITVNNGVFDAAKTEDKKVGSILYLALLIPLIIMFRKRKQ